LPDLREVFELTTKQMGEPDVDSWREEEKRQRRASRNKRLGALAVAAAIGLVAVVVVIRTADDGTETQPAVQPTPTPPAGTVPKTDYLIDLNTGEMTPLPKSIAGNGLSDWYAVSPDAKMVAYTSQNEAGTLQVFIASLDGTDVQQVTHDPKGAALPDWSPDGAAIAYQGHPSGNDAFSSRPNNIFVLDLATGETSQVTYEKPKSELGAIGPQFSPDGASIVYAVNRGLPTSVARSPLRLGWGVRIVPVTGGRSIPLVGGKGTDIEAVQAGEGTLSPDGSTLAVGCFGPLEGICIAHADGTKVRALVGDPSSSGPTWSPDGTRIAFHDGDTREVFLVDVATGEIALVAVGTGPEWLDDHTLIVEVT
jgi:Tol biopolymer transport system component